MTFLDYMEKRPGTTIIIVMLLNLMIVVGVFVGALALVKWMFF